MPAPTAIDGEKSPPGMPATEEAAVASSLSGPKDSGSGVPCSISARTWTAPWSGQWCR